MSFHVDAEITVWCESVKPGCTFAARLYDRKLETHFSGAGSTAFEALAWCLDDYVRRGLLGHGPTPALNSDARPGDGLAPATSSRLRRITPAPIVIGPPRADDPKAEIACFERRIPMTPAPRLFTDAPAAISTPTTPRRARGGRR